MTDWPWEQDLSLAGPDGLLRGWVGFEPQIVRKRRHRLSGVDEVILSLDAKGLITGQISAHFAEVYGASVSKQTISRITDVVLE